MFSCDMRCIAACPLLLVLLTVLPGQSFGQTGVKGTISAADSGELLGGTQIYLPRLKRGTVTDEAGRYAVSGLAPGTYTLEYSLLGYEKRIRTITLVADVEDAMTLDIELRQTVVKADEVIIVADNPRKTSDIPLTTISVDQVQRIERGRMSLWEDLALQPGVARLTNGPGIERPYLRGLSGGRILLMMHNLPYSYQTWDPESGLSTNGIGAEQVDVIQGPVTLQYGPGAMGGVINVAPEYPAPVGKTRGAARAGLYSNTEGLFGELALKQSQRNFFWGARANVDSHADYKSGEEEGDEGGARKTGEDEEEGRVLNSRYDHVDAQAFIGLSRSWGSTRLTYEFLQHRTGVVEAEEEEEGREEEGERDIEPPYHALRDHILASDTQVKLGSGWLHTVLGLQINKQQEFEPEDEIPADEIGEAAMDLNLTTFHYRLDYETALEGPLSLTGGVQGRVQKNESEGIEPFVPNADIQQVGAFGLATWQRDNVVVSGGLRYDLHSVTTEPATGGEEVNVIVEDGRDQEEVERTFSLISGSLGATIKAEEGQYVKVNVGAGNRAPDIAELTANGLLREVRRYLTGDENLNAEYNLGSDASLGWQFQVANVSVGGFFNRIGDYIYPSSTGQIIEEYPVFEYIQNDASFYGGHATVSLTPTGASGFLLQSRFDIVMADLSDAAEDHPPMIPAPHWLNGVEWRGMAIGPFQRLRFRVELDTYLEQNNVPVWEDPGEAYSLVNVSVNARLPMGSQAVIIGINGLNILNKAYISNLSLLKPDGIRDMGRNITISALVPFGS